MGQMDGKDQMEIWPTDENCKMEASCHPSTHIHILDRLMDRQSSECHQP